MSSEGEHVSKTNGNIKKNLIPHVISSCLFHLQCSRLSFVCPLHPAITTTYTTWTRQKAYVTFLTSQFSTFDPKHCYQRGKKFPLTCCFYLQYLQAFTHSLKVGRSAGKQVQCDGRSGTPLHRHAELQPHEEMQARTKHFNSSFFKEI